MTDNGALVPHAEGACAPLRRGMDADRMLLLVLIALLWKNGASPELLLALVYVAM